MDHDADGVITAEESATYADLLKHDLSLQLDTQDLPLKLTASDIPTPAELRTGAGIMQMEFSAAPDPLATGSHTLTLKNLHIPKVSVYLINAAKPKAAAIQINRQTRNENQSAGEIAFTFQPPVHTARTVSNLVVIGGLLIVVFMVGWRVLRKLPAGSRDISRW